MQKISLMLHLSEEEIFMRHHKNIPLVSSEIAGLWDTYTSDSLAIHVLSYFLKNVSMNVLIFITKLLN